MVRDNELWKDLPKKSFVMVIITGFMLFTMADDIPEVEFSKHGNVEGVENGQCRLVKNGTLCFNTWKIADLNTGIVTMAYASGDVDFDFVESIRYIFVRESFLFSESWSKNSSFESDNSSNISIPEYDVEVVEGTE